MATHTPINESIPGGLCRALSCLFLAYHYGKDDNQPFWVNSDLFASQKLFSALGAKETNYAGDRAMFKTGGGGAQEAVRRGLRVAHEAPLHRQGGPGGVARVDTEHAGPRLQTIPGHPAEGAEHRDIDEGEPARRPVTVAQGRPARVQPALAGRRPSSGRGYTSSSTRTTGRGSSNSWASSFRSCAPFITARRPRPGRSPAGCDAGGRPTRRG